MTDTPEAAPAAPEKPIGYQVNSHPGLRVLIIVLMTLFLYSIFDTYFLNAYTYVSAPPLMICLIVAGAALPIGLFMGRGAPTVDHLGIVVMFAAACGLATYPATLRINQMTDAEAPRLITYQYAGDGRFTSEAEGYPALDVMPREKLRFVPVGTTHPFEFANGALGLYQVNIKRIRSELKDARVSISAAD